MKKQRILNPIIDWTEEDVWEFIKTYNVPYCKLYDEGFKRLGCIGCPMAGDKRIREFEKYPKIKEAYIRAFQRMVDKRKEDGMECVWNTGQEVFDWWMSK